VHELALCVIIPWNEREELELAILNLMKIQSYEVANLAVVKPTLLDAKTCKACLVNAERLDLEDDDRRTLDSIIFDVLALTQGERDVYEAVINLVEARLKKAGSV